MKVLYFAWLKTRTGCAEEDLTPPAEVTTVGAFLTWLATQSPRHAEALKDPRLVRVAVNQTFAQADTPITSGDELALFPPVTGGAMGTQP